MDGHFEKKNKYRLVVVNKKIINIYTCKKKREKKVEREKIIITVPNG